MDIHVQLRLFVVHVFFVITTAWGQTSKLDITISTDNNFTISVSGQEWFCSGPIEGPAYILKFVTKPGRWLGSANGTLVLNGTYDSSGVDKLGAYSCIYFEYHSKPGWFQIHHIR